MSDWQLLHIHTFIWFTNTHLYFSSDLLSLLTSKICLFVDHTFNLLLSPTYLLISYPKARTFIFSCEIITVWLCGVYSGTLFSFPLNKYFANTTARKGIGKKSESSTKEQRSPLCWKKSPKTPWALKAEPAPSVRANTTATLLFSIHTLCVLVQGHESMPPTKEKPVFVFTSSAFAAATRCPDTLWCSSSGEQSLGRRQRWEVVPDLGLGACWSSPTFSQSLETSGNAVCSVSSVRELQSIHTWYWWARAEKFPGLMVCNL